jgi:anaerobic C4-dicarboxylate transporter DcuA
VAFIVVSGFFPGLRPQFPGSNGSMERLSMTLTIQLVRLALSAIMLWLTKPAIESIPRTKTAQAGLTAIIGIFGLAWLGDTFIQGNEAVIIGSMSAMVKGFCQVVGVETLIRQAGASPRSYPPVRPLAPCL